MICHLLLVPESPSDELLLGGMLAGFTLFEATHNGKQESYVQKRGCRCKTQITLLVPGEVGPLELTKLIRAQEVVAIHKDMSLIGPLVDAKRHLCENLLCVF